VVRAPLTAPLSPEEVMASEVEMELSLKPQEVASQAAKGITGDIAARDGHVSASQGWLPLRDDEVPQDP